VRAAIQDAALQCFERLGIERTTMSDVASAAGVTRQTVYNHYENKNALVAAIVAAEAKRVSSEALARVDLGLESDDLVVEAELALLDAAHNSPLATVLLSPESVGASAATVADALATGDLGAMRAFWDPILDQLAHRRALRNDDRRHTIEWLTMIHFSLATRPSLRTDPDAARELLRAFVVPSIVD